MLPRVLPQSRPAGGLVVALFTLKQVLSAVLDASVRLQVSFHSTAVLTEVTFVGLFPGVNAEVPLQVGVDFELCVALLALKRCVTLKEKEKINEGCVPRSTR